MDESFKIPQSILTDHAKRAGVRVIDFTRVFEEIIFREPIVKSLRDDKFSYGEIRQLYTNRVRKYFLDGNHYTPEGHRIIASGLYEYLHTHVFSDGVATRAG
jgi:lysophospholipase L1-like esterase